MEADANGSTAAADGMMASRKLAVAGTGCSRVAQNLVGDARVGCSQQNRVTRDGMAMGRDPRGVHKVHKYSVGSWMWLGFCF